MRSLAKYAYINAKVRGMLSNFLSEKELQALIHASDVDGVFQVLKNSPYKALVQKIEAAHPDYRKIESLLLEEEIRCYSDILKHLKGSPYTLVSLMLERYEVDNLKNVLRIWHKQSFTEESEYIFKEKICHEMPIEEMVNARAVEEIILLLSGTPYKVPLLASRERFKKEDRLFYLETAIETDYYARLWETIDTLSAADRTIAKKLIGMEIDLKNLNWILRYKKYYDIPTGEVMQYIIPRGYRIKEDMIREAYLSTDLSGSISGFLGVLYKFSPPGEEEREAVISSLIMIEEILWRLQLQEARKALGGYPFTIGTLIAFFVLGRREFYNVRSILNCKFYRMSPEETLSHIIDSGVRS